VIWLSTTPEHVASVASRLRPRDREEFRAVYGDLAPDVLTDVLRGLYGSYEGLLTGCRDDGLPVFVGGGVQLRPNTATMVFMATDDFRRIAKAATRFIRDTFLPSMERQGIHRIECVTLGEYIEMQRWLRLLGFRMEGVAQAYGAAGEDFHYFARVKRARPTCH
jgi:hypothetical protein